MDGAPRSLRPARCRRTLVLPHAEGDRLVYLRQSAELAGIDNVLFSVPEIIDFRQAGADREAASPVMVLTYDYWMSAFGGDPGVVGEAVDLGGRTSTIVGVVESVPHYPSETDVLVNMVTSDHHISATMVHGRTHWMTEVFGRLSPGDRVRQRGEPDAHALGPARGMTNVRLPRATASMSVL